MKSHNKSKSYSIAKEKISEISSIFADFGIPHRLFCALDVLRFLFAFVEIGFQQVVLGTEGVLNVGFVQIGYQLLSRHHEIVFGETHVLQVQLERLRSEFFFFLKALETLIGFPVLPTSAEDLPFEKVPHVEDTDTDVEDLAQWQNH